MLRTLFFIPNAEIAGLPIFGRGWLLLAWAVFSVVLLIWLIRKQGPEGEAWGYLPLLVLVAAAIWWLLPKICEPIPGREPLTGLPIRGYGTLMLLAVVAGVGLAAWRAFRVGVDPELMFTLAFWLFVPGIIGARAFYVIEYWGDFQQDTIGETVAAVINITKGGQTVYGSLIGAMAGFVGFICVYKLPPLATLDLIAPSFALGMAVGRLGCLMNGCCFGGVCDMPHAIRFPVDSPPYLHQVEHGEAFLQGMKIPGGHEAEPVIAAVQPGSPAESQGLEPGQKIVSIHGVPVQTAGQTCAQILRAQQHDAEMVIAVGTGKTVRWPITRPLPWSEPIHPTQLYSALNGLLICLFLLAYAPFRRRDGVVWAMFLTLYPLTRFLLEMIRTDEPGVFDTGLTISQVVSLILLLSAAAFWVYAWMKPPGTAFATFREASAAA